MFSSLTRPSGRKEAVQDPVRPGPQTPIQEPEVPDKPAQPVEPVNPAGPPPDKTPVPGTPEREKLVGLIRPKAV